MRVSHSLQKSFPIVVLAGCAAAALAVFASADESFLSKPSEEWTEAEALQVLNDSPWAHPVTTSVQDYQCDYEHAAFPGMYSDESARRLDAAEITPPAVPLQPDGAEYVVRLNSARPMQAAVNRLVSLDRPKWARYDGSGTVLEPGGKPTNIKEKWFNPADEIHLSIVLKRPGPGGASFLSYAFGQDGDRYHFPGGGLSYLWPCAGIKTSGGQVFAVTGGFGFKSFSKDATPSAINLSFPSVFRGKLLISQPNEKIEFRFIANQRVFETTFVVNPSDLILNEPETVPLRMPPTVDEPTAASKP
jgi:hypothetical protein